MSQDSHCSASSLELMSQDTRDLLQSLLNDKGSNLEQDFQAQYILNPFDIHLVEESSPENVEINIERVCSFSSSHKAEMPDFSSCYNGSPESQVSSTTHDNLQNQTSYPDQQASSPIIQPQQTNDVKNEQGRPHPQTTDHNSYTRQCLVPPNTDFPGPFHFDVGFQEEKGHPAKSAPWTYSSKLQKLFIKMRFLVPLRFIFKARPPAGSYIKALVVYSKPEHYRDIVERCMNHIVQQNDGHQAPKHLLRCENLSTVYETCHLTGRHLIKVPVREAEAGVDYFTEMFQFMCFNSCPGGLNRRPIIVIFTTELNGKVIGRKIITPRICACPGRDRGNEETAEQKKIDRNLTNPEATQVQPNQVSLPISESPLTQRPGENTKPALIQQDNRTAKKRSSTKITEGFQLQSLSAYKKIKREEDEVFTIQVVGREKYELLLKIKESVDLMDMIPQTSIDNYRMSCPPCGPNWFLEQQQKLQREKQKHEEYLRDSQEATNSQGSDSDGTLPSSQTQEIPQMSRTSSNTSSQGSNPSDGTEYSTVRFTLKRTVSLERKGLRKKEVE